MTSKKAAADNGVSAALQFIAQFDEQTKRACGPGQDLAPLLDELGAAWKPLGIDPSPAGSAVAAYRAQWDFLCEGKYEPERFNPHPLMTTDRHAVIVGLAESIAASNTPAETDELSKARSDLAALEKDVAAGNAAMDRAVRDRDMKKIDELRARTQLELPKQLAETRLRVLELELARRIETETAGAHFKSVEWSRLDNAEQAVTTAERAVRTATEALDAARTRAMFAERVWKILGSEKNPTESASVLQAERDRLLAEAAADDERRFRQFAGVTG